MPIVTFITTGLNYVLRECIVTCENGVGLCRVLRSSSSPNHWRLLVAVVIYSLTRLFLGWHLTALNFYFIGAMLNGTQGICPQSNTFHTACAQKKSHWWCQKSYNCRPCCPSLLEWVKKKFMHIFKLQSETVSYMRINLFSSRERRETTQFVCY